MTLQGHGHLASYLDHDKVTAYIALEPNTNMHTRLREKAASFGFEEAKGNFLILAYGAQEIDKIVNELHQWSAANPSLISSSSALGKGMVIDTLVCILTICSIPQPKQSVHSLVHRLLRPGGQFLWYEHVRNPRPTVARVQDFVAPIWRKFFDGCVVGLDSVSLIWDAGFMSDAYDMGKRVSDVNVWAEMITWNVDGEDKDSLFWHQVGRWVKRA